MKLFVLLWVHVAMCVAGDIAKNFTLISDRDEAIELEFVLDDIKVYEVFKKKKN